MKTLQAVVVFAIYMSFAGCSKKWEYQTLEAESLSHLNTYGKYGWEVCGVCADKIILKREAREKVDYAEISELTQIEADAAKARLEAIHRNP